jgi:hypothetical protein
VDGRRRLDGERGKIRTVDPLADLITRQSGMVARRQLLALGLDADRVRNQVAAGRWVSRSPRVLSTTTGELTWQQRCWLGVLHAGPHSLVGSLTAAGLWGLERWTRPHVTVFVDDELSVEPVPGIAFFRSRRPFQLLASSRAGLPLVRLEPAVLLFAAYEARPRAAHGVLAASVQQRLTTAAKLEEWIDLLRPLRRGRAFRRSLADIDSGAHSAAELAVRRMCRRHRLALPDRQRPRTDRAGRRRWTDCEWDLPGGGVLILEVDGSFHLEVDQWSADIRRARRLTTRDRIVVRCTSYELHHEDHEVAADLIALGVPRMQPNRAA